MGFQVVALSSGPAKESLARDLGAHHYFDGSQIDQVEALQSMGGAKVILCTAPNSEAAQKLIPGLGVNGTLVVLILETDPIAVSPSKYSNIIHNGTTGPYLVSRSLYAGSPDLNHRLGCGACRE